MKATEKGIKDSMSSSKASKSETAELAAKTVARLYFLDLSAGRILTSNPDGSDLKTIVNEGRQLPDGIVVDVARGHIYWTNMGNPKANDGTIDRADLDGTNVTNVVPPGATWTPKQLQLDAKNRKLYWTQKGAEKAGQGRIFRANLDVPVGQTPANRQDIELLYNNLPEPIDLDLDLGNRIMYWTDRGDPPRGNTVNRAPMDATNGNRPEPEIVFNHLMEGIGLALDLDNGRMFVTDLAGSVYSANLDGSNKKPVIFAQGNLTGIAYAELPAVS